MTKELAKTLTTALVQFIDREIPEETMCCSNAECESIEEMFGGDKFDIIEAFIQKKLSRLTEFETHLKWLIENGGSGIEHVKVGANELLAIAKKELQPEIDAEIEKAYNTQDNVVFHKGWEHGRADALKDLPRWRRWENGACGNSDNHPIAIVKRGFSYVLVTTLGVQGEHYIMLSDLEKLPGFKED